MNNGNQVWIWIVVAVIVIGGGWWLLASKPAATDSGTGPINIGVVLPLTGDAATYGEPARNLYQMAVDTINAAGGVNGRMLNLIIEDGKCTGQDATNAAQKLVNVDKVQVILGGFCSGESLAIVPVAAQAKVAVLSPGSSSPKLTDISPYFARNYPSDSAQGKVLADIAYNDKSWRTVAFIQEQTDYAQGVYQAFSDEFKSLGGSVTNDQFQTATNDFRSILAKVKGQAPDAVFVDTQTAAAASRIFTQMSQLGWSPKMLLSDVIIGDSATLQANKALLEGALGAEFGVSSSPEFKTLLADYKAKYDSDMPYQSYGQTEYDAVFILRDAIAAVGYNGAKIANWLHTDVQDWQGVTGSVTIGADGDPAAGHKPEVVKGGVAVPYTK